MSRISENDLNPERAADMNITPENSVKLLLENFGTESPEIMQIAAALYVAPYGPGDHKSTTGLWMRGPDGKINKLAGKNYGNFLAGVLAAATNVPEPVFQRYAGRIQALVDIKYLLREFYEQQVYGASMGDVFADHSWGEDDPLGKQYTTAGFSWATRQQYKQFTMFQLEEKFTSVVLPPGSRSEGVDLQADRWMMGRTGWTGRDPPPFDADQNNEVVDMTGWEEEFPDFDESEMQRPEETIPIGLD